MAVYAIEVQYWYVCFSICGFSISFFGRQHCEHYPNSVPLLQEHVTDMWGTVAYAYIGLTKLVYVLTILN